MRAGRWRSAGFGARTSQQEEQEEQEEQEDKVSER